MNLYLILDEGDDRYVLALSYSHAISKWMDCVEKNYEPELVTLIADADHIIL